MSDAAQDIAVVAAEASGDLLVAGVLQSLRQHLAPQPMHACGIGGPMMQAQGFDAWWTIDALSVRGYAEVLREYPRLRRMRNDLRERLIRMRPALFLGVDAPDFNLGLERDLRAAGIPSLHFIGPSVWAWRRERLARIRESVDHMLLIFPFEESLYREANIPATYVGHPLADMIPQSVDRDAARRALGLPLEAGVVALLPGSRPAELRYMAASFLEAADLLGALRPNLRFVLPAAGHAQYEHLRALLESRPVKAQILLTQGQSHQALAACDTALVASGTATLEAALFGRPMVIAYRMAALSYLIMRKMAYLPWIGLPNILCRDAVVPEFIQAAATPAALSQALLAQLEDPAARERIVARFADLHQSLRRDCAERCAEVLLSYASRGRT